MVTANTARCRTHRQRARGFTYLAVLLAIAILGLGLTTASEVWVSTARHHRLIEVDWIGAQFVQAIGSYYETAPNGVKTYPLRLDELLEDRRSPVVRRHLRAIYLNPLSGKADWQTISGGDGRIHGIRILLDDKSKPHEFVYIPGDKSPAVHSLR
jgi:type II secretory pathway pseudopilin PulG